MQNRSRLFNNGAEVRVINTLDAVCFNENGTDKYFPSDFDIRVILHRNPRNKYIRGYTGTTAQTDVNSIDLALSKFSLKLPMFKPKDQLASAINRTMVTNEKECIFYTMHYRLVNRPVAAQAGDIRQDIFTGSRPTRVFFGLQAQNRWNGQFGGAPLAQDAVHNNANINTYDNPPRNNLFKVVLPNFTYCALRINEAIIQPEYRNQKEAYIEFRKMLNRFNREMPFNYEEYLTDYGWIPFDLSPNKDSFNEVLPNSTTGNVSFEINFGAPLPNYVHQAIFIAEFRNEEKIGFNTPARKIYDF